MTQQHFKEILETVVMSTHSTKGKIASYLNISGVTLWRYQEFGLPRAKRVIILDKLRKYLFSNLGIS